MNGIFESVSAYIISLSTGKLLSGMTVLVYIPLHFSGGHCFSIFSSSTLISFTLHFMDY